MKIERTAEYTKQKETETNKNMKNEKKARKGKEMEREH